MQQKQSSGVVGERHARVMVVDESPSVLQSLLLLLQHFGFDTKGFLDGQDALREVKQYEPDVLICDAHTEEVEDEDEGDPRRIEGIETASAVKRERPECKVIVLSTNLKPGLVTERAKRLGANIETMPKPTSPTVLISAVRQMAA